MMFFFFFKQKTAYEMRISDWSSDVCSSDLYSRDCLRELRQDTALAYDERTLGTLQVFQTQEQFDASAKDLAVLRDLGVPHELLSRDGCLSEIGRASCRERVCQYV